MNVSCPFCNESGWNALNGENNYECLTCGARIHYKVTAKPRPTSPLIAFNTVFGRGMMNK